MGIIIVNIVDILSIIFNILSIIFRILPITDIIVIFLSIIGNIIDILSIAIPSDLHAGHLHDKDGKKKHTRPTFSGENR